MTLPVPALMALALTVASAQNAPKPVPHAVRTAGPSPEKISKEAQVAREAHRIDDAIALYQKGVSLKPSWDEGWWFLGTLYYGRDDYAHGRDAFRRLTEITPEAAQGWAMLGLCEFQTRQFDMALKHLGNAIHLGIDKDEEISRVARYHFALVLTRYERYEEAMKVLVLFAQRDLEAPDYVEALGIAALRKPLLPSELPPTEREMVMDAGRALYDAASRKAAPAAAEFKALAAKYPDQPNVHYLYGSFLMTGDEHEAIAEMEKELVVSPHHVPALVTVASQYLARQDYQTALTYAEKAAEAGPQSFAAHAVLGRVLAEGGLDNSRGLEELELARKLAPNSPQVRIALASAYVKAGRKEDASWERQEFLRLKKQSDAENAGVP